MKKIGRFKAMAIRNMVKHVHKMYQRLSMSNPTEEKSVLLREIYHRFQNGQITSTEESLIYANEEMLKSILTFDSMEDLCGLLAAGLIGADMNDAMDFDFNEELENMVGMQLSNLGHIEG